MTDFTSPPNRTCPGCGEGHLDYGKRNGRTYTFEGRTYGIGHLDVVECDKCFDNFMTIEEVEFIEKLLPIQDEVLKVLTDMDLIGICRGNPGWATEYMAEARDIAVLIARGGVVDLVVEVHKIMCHWFTPSVAGPISRYEELAKRLSVLLVDGPPS